MVKNLSAMQETQVQSLDWEDPLEKEMGTHSSVLGWEIPWSEHFIEIKYHLKLSLERYLS